MQRAATFVGGLAIGFALSGSLVVLRAQTPSPAGVSDPSPPAHLGRYQMSYGGAYLYLVDTTNGETFQAQSFSDGKWKWVPDMPPLSR